jgi:orotate phosphoribosyltransferase
MHLVPTQDEVVRILRDTGALREGHFIYPDGRHAAEYLQVPLAMRYYQHAKMLSVSLSRLLRANPEIRAVIPELSIVSPATGGLPVAYGVCEALQAKQVYWAEDAPGGELVLRQYVEPQKGELVVLVDDILHSGNRLSQLKAKIESFGAIVVAMAVVIFHPTPKVQTVGDVPFYYLARLDASYYPDAASCELCKKSQLSERVRH